MRDKDVIGVLDKAVLQAEHALAKRVYEAWLLDQEADVSDACCDLSDAICARSRVRDLLEASDE